MKASYCKYGAFTRYVFIFLRSKLYIVEDKFVKARRFREIARQKTHRAEFGVIEYVRFQKHGCGDVQPFANVRKIVEKLRVYYLPFALISKLFQYLFVLNYFRPDFKHIIIIQKYAADRKYFSNILTTIF